MKKTRVVWRFNDSELDGDRNIMAKKPPKRRVESGTPRAYGDFRDFSDVGAGFEALIPPGKHRSTTDPELAEKLASDRLDELREKRLRGAHGIPERVRLGEYASHYLERKAEAGKVTARWLKCVERHLRVALDYFGENRELAQIRVSDLRDYLSHLKDMDNGQGGKLSPATQRKYLNSLSDLFGYAQNDEVVEPGHNPVRLMKDKPTAEIGRPNWLEAHEAAYLLEAAKTDDVGHRRAFKYSHPLVATFLLTGGRKSEVLGLKVSDLDFERKQVSFEPNEYRRLKTASADRSVPMPTQLAEILRPYLSSGVPNVGGLLFPSPEGEDNMMSNTRHLFDRLLRRMDGFEEGEVRTKDLRHTFCSAALQLIDRGEPIAPYTVSRWMGHGGLSLVERVYSHLGEVRHRATEVEFRVANHRDKLDSKLEALEEAA